MCVSHLDQSIAQLSVGQFGLYLGGWLGWAIATLPSGGAQICHQGALLNCKRCFSSAICGPIWLILGWVVRVGHSYLDTVLLVDLLLLRGGQNLVRRGHIDDFFRKL